jgi:thiamine pyridinylase
MTGYGARRGPGPGGGKGLSRPGTQPPARSEVGVLNVAPYQWVPQPAWFQNAITSAWAEVHPEIALNWCSYDCYHDDPPATLDVFAFDSIFASYFINQQYLQAFPVMDLGDFLPWSLVGLTVNSEWLWAVPYLGCLNTLIYRAADTRLGDPGLTNPELLEILGVSPNTSPEPPPGSGLLVDFTGGTTDACMYLQTVMENAGSYPIDPALPPWTDLDPAALNDLRQLVTMAGLQQASYFDPNSVRLDWFMAGPAIGATARGAVAASLAWLAPTTVSELLADLRLLEVSRQVRALTAG